MIRATIKKFVKEKFYRKYLNNRQSFNYYGEKVFFPKDSTTFQSVMATGIYERENLQFIMGNLTEGGTYLDIGANIGLMSIPPLKQFQNLQVIAVEASPNTFSFLKNTQEGSSFKERWHILNKAVSDSAGEIDFYVGKASDGAYEGIKDTARNKYSTIVKVPAVTIDDIWNEFNKPGVSFIKSDIEGADLLALRGGKKCIDACKPVILIEWNKVNIIAYGFKNSDLLDWCNEMDYKCYSVPAIVRINDDGELDQQMILTENFMLLPVA